MSSLHKGIGIGSRNESTLIASCNLLHVFTACIYVFSAPVTPLKSEYSWHQCHQRTSLPWPVEDKIKSNEYTHRVKIKIKKTILYFEI